MRIFLAGNFPQLRNKVEEIKMIDKMIVTYNYRRLVSYYYILDEGIDIETIFKYLPTSIAAEKGSLL